MKILVIGFLAVCCFASVKCQDVTYAGTYAGLHAYTYNGKPITVPLELHQRFLTNYPEARQIFLNDLQQKYSNRLGATNNREVNYQEPFRGNEQINFNTGVSNEDTEAQTFQTFNKQTSSAPFPFNNNQSPVKPNRPVSNQQGGNFGPNQQGGNFGQNQQGGNFGQNQQGGNFGSNQQGGNFGSNQPRPVSRPEQNRPVNRKPAQGAQVLNDDYELPAPTSGYNRPIPDRDVGERDRRDKPINEFAWRLFKACNSQPNYVLSPLTPQILLNYLAWVGEGRTRNEIAAATGYGSPKVLQKTVKSLLTESGKREFNIATAFFTATDMRLNDDFLTRVNQNGDADVIPVDFKNPAVAGRAISKWATGKTKNRLKLNEINYAPSTKIALTSALYFKSNWIFRFNPATKGTFYSDQGPVQVDMMNMKRKFRWGQIQDYAEWAAIPYESGDSLIIILPNRNHTLDQVINRMGEQDFSDVLHAFDRDGSNADLNITLPKFKLDTTTSLVEPLKKMGIQTLFSPNADLPYLSDYDQVQVSNAEQQASIDVNEEGTVVVSFTNLNVVALSFTPPVPSVDMVVDRPFLAIVGNRERNIPYVLAKITNPVY